MSRAKRLNPQAGPQRVRRTRSLPARPAGLILPGAESGTTYFLSILVILVPCRPIPAISPFWPKTKA